MIENYVCRISKVTGRYILKMIILDDQRFQRIPTQEDAERIAEELNRERKIYVKPSYLLDVWQETFKG